MLTISAVLPRSVQLDFISPANIYPGDVFVVQVHTKEKPRGTFQDRPVNFYLYEDRYRGLGFLDMNTKPGIYPLKIEIGGLISHQNVEVKHKEFPVKHITLQSDKVFLSPEDEKRANEEEALLKSIWNRITPYPLWTDNFIKPINSAITSPFGVKRII
ncbi:MAG: hypothetical protein GTN99_10230, partial [Candidatus Dadabacteria bacterium]|nr:hypothetical protein [Candidatus Dadabacteria bacterium]